ncbi:MAG: hypothetical protein CSB55_00340 [Candidatus Cloacimonadota bacterium]|nr:MAG: hypothetical protein CSB55_00340 [Candidatus Cloacimonadota bacterium]
MNKIKNIFGAIIIVFLLLLLFYLLGFSYIEPSVKKFEKRNLDLNLWNADGDIGNIEYYFIFDKNSKTLNIERDKNGIFYRLKKNFDPKKYVFDSDKDTLYMPTDMSAQIILDFNQFKISSDPAYLADIEIMKKWLLENVVFKDSLAFWRQPAGFNKYGLETGWTGAWAIGNQLSALARLYQLEPSEEIKILTEKLINNLKVEVKNGGTASFDENGNIRFEEYPSVPANSVLNGHINACLGLYDFWRVSSDPEAKKLFEAGVKTVAESLDEYDAGYWSFYDGKYSYICDYKYHNGVHVPQLKILYQITGKEIFKTYYLKWENYNNEPYFSLAKIKMLLDAFSRRLKYKSIFTRG